MSEIRWTHGKEKYDREEINSMLETQRAMIYNDVIYLLIAQAEAIGKRGSLTKNGEEIVEALKDCRRVVF